MRPMGHAGRPSKGTRKLIRVIDLRPPVRAEIVRRAAEAGVPVSGYLADHLAIHVGRPDLVRHLNNVGIRTVDRPAASQAAHPNTGATVARVDEPVHIELHRLATSTGLKHIAAYVSTWCETHVSASTDTQIGHRQEELAVIA